MDALSAALGLETAQLTQIIIVAVVLLGGLFFARLAFKLTASLMRLGCLAIFLLIAALFLLRVFSG
jgi:hypothetical protein